VVLFAFLQARILWFLLPQFGCFEGDKAVWILVLKKITADYVMLS
jgi:hypothetical protein